jgi:hypothetical protein
MKKRLSVKRGVDLTKARSSRQFLETEAVAAVRDLPFRLRKGRGSLRPMHFCESGPIVSSTPFPKILKWAPEPPTGIGESLVPTVGPAVSNAIFVTGRKRVTNRPLTKIEGPGARILRTRIFLFLLHVLLAPWISPRTCNRKGWLQAGKRRRDPRLPHLGFRTFGKLNEARSYAILFGCTTEQIQTFLPRLVIA